MDDDPGDAGKAMGLQVPYIASDAMMEEDLEREPLCKPGRDQLGNSQTVDEGRKRLGSGQPSTSGGRRSVTVNTFGAYYDKKAVRVTQTYTASQSGFATTFEGSCSSSGEFVRIEGSDVTTKALELCEKWALRPYRCILMMLGWLPLGTDKLSAVNKKALHILLVSFWMLVIIGAFITQILSCFRRDKFLAFRDADSWEEIVSDVNDSNSSSLRALKCNTHLFNNFIFFDILLIVVYLYGVYLFWGEERDLTHLHTLASRSFVQNSLASLKNNRVLLSIIMVFSILGCTWIVTSFIIRVLTIICAELFMDDVVIEWGNVTYAGYRKKTLISLSVVGFVFFDIVYVAATMNYTVQSELIIWLLKAITTMLYRNGYCNVDAAIKDILECRRYLRNLNGRASTAVAMLLFIFGNMATLGIVYGFDYANDNEDREDKEIFRTMVAVMNIALWLSIIALPIIQATRVTHACQQLKDSATEIRSRPQLYVETPQLDLDSFIILTQAIRLRATLFGVPVYPSLVYAVLASVTFVMIFLAQTNIYSFSNVI